MCFSKGNPNQIGYFIPPNILDDLCRRFIGDLPRTDLSDLVQLCFRIELAHWYYLDKYREMYNLRPCGLRLFAIHIFQHLPDLNRHIPNIDSVLEDWRKYKRSIPTYGAILLDEDQTHVLLVQGFSSKPSWGFPKGKVNREEEPWNCAAREVLEETGFDISKLINKNEFINAVVFGIRIRLYIVGNIPRDTKFKPLTQNEIKACEWFPIHELPSHKKDITSKVKTSASHNPFLMVIPFLKKIKRWVFWKKLNKSAIEVSTTKTETGISNAATNDQKQNYYQDEDLSTQELFNAYRKYLQRNQPFKKLLNMARENQQQNLSYYIYQDGELYQMQSFPMSPNNSHIWSTNMRSDNNQADYQQDLPTQYLKNALMIYEHQDFPYFESQDSQLYKENCASNNSQGSTENTSEHSLRMNESKLAGTGKQQMKPGEFISRKTVQKEHFCDTKLRSTIAGKSQTLQKSCTS